MLDGLGQMALQLGDPLGGLVLRPLELLAARSGSLKLALERADPLLDLGADTGLVSLGGLVQPGLELVEALRERVPLGQRRSAAATRAPRSWRCSRAPAPARTAARARGRARAQERRARAQAAGRKPLPATVVRAPRPQAPRGPTRRAGDRSRAVPLAESAAPARPAASAASAAAARRCESARGRPSRAGRRSFRTRFGAGRRAARQARSRLRPARRSRDRRAPCRAGCRCGSARRGRPEAGLPSGSPRRP